MLEIGAAARDFQLKQIDGKSCAVGAENGDGPVLLAFFSVDCPTCQLTMPYIDRLADAVASSGGRVIAVSQDPPDATRTFLDQTGCRLPVVLDESLAVSRDYDPDSVPTLFLIDGEFKIVRTEVGFSKKGLNGLARQMGKMVGIEAPEIAPEHDGSPEAKPGCESRHREPGVESAEEPQVRTGVYVKRGRRASRVEVPDGADPYDFCREQGFGDPLPVVPPTVERVEKFLRATKLAPEEVIGLVPPNYATATVEKIAANAVMAGCAPEMMKALIPTVRAVCDEKFNIHGVQATTHFVAPLVLVNGPIREELGFWSRGNVFSNVARANSTLGRALQLILTNLGGARPGEIDMSTLGNPGKFSFCIAENEEVSPWEPFHVERGFRADQSTVTLFASEAPTGVSEHNTREGKEVLRAISRALCNIWTYRACMLFEGLVVIGPEHAATLDRDGFSKADARDFLFENTAVPVKEFEAAGTEGTSYVAMLKEVTIDGEPHYRKFRAPESIRIIVAGGGAGKFSAVLGSWLTGPRGSEVVTYPID